MKTKYFLFTDSCGDAVMINTSVIRYFEKYENKNFSGTRIILDNDSEYVIQESIEEIWRKPEYYTREI